MFRVSPTTNGFKAVEFEDLRFELNDIDTLVKEGTPVLLVELLEDLEQLETHLGKINEIEVLNEHNKDS